MIEFLNRLFGKQSSGATAKERLRLVLMSDHLSLAPEMIDSMKRDLVDVISRYVEVDRSKIDVHFENQDNALAMLANIPITGVARTTPPDPPSSNGNSSDGTDEASKDTAQALARHGEPVEPAPTVAETRAPRRKKRKKQGGPGHQPGAPAPAT
jgi:cell division topological specificity factor